MLKFWLCLSHLCFFSSHIFLLPEIRLFYSSAASFYSDSFGRNYDRWNMVGREVGKKAASPCSQAVGRIMKDLMSSSMLYRDPKAI